MVVRGSDHYYFDELAEMSDGRLVLPQRWYETKSRMCFDYFSVREETAGTFMADSTVVSQGAVMDLRNPIQVLRATKAISAVCMSSLASF
jgi:hypothetical protein